MSDMSWGWTSYKRTGWVDGDDPALRLYLGYFYRQDNLLTFTKQKVEFWAHQPILALRTICDSGEEPVTFERQEVN